MTKDYAEFGGDFELRLLALYVREPDQALSVIEPSYFTSPIHMDIARIVKEAYKGRDISSTRLTKASLRALVSEKLQQKSGRHVLKNLYRKTVRKLFEVHLPDRDILLDQARRFAQQVRYREALIRAEQDINKCNYDAAIRRFLDIRTQEANTRNRSSAMPAHHLHRFISEEQAVDEQQDHLVYPIVPKHGGVLLYGLPKELKSWFGAALAVDVAAGRKALGYFAVRHPVKTLFVQVEDPEFLTRERMRELVMSQGHRKPFGMLKVVPRCPLNLPDPAWMALLVAEIERFKPELIVLDVLRRLFRGNVADAQETSAFLSVLDKLRDVHGCAIVLVHHARKAETEEIQTRALGSVNLTAWADVLIYTGGKHRVGTASVADLQIETKSALVDETNLDVVVDSESWPMVQVLQKGRFEFEFLKGIIRASEGINQVQLEQESGIPEKRLRGLLQEGEQKEIWYSQRGNRKELRYYLSKKGGSGK
jgi:AAA domain